MNISKPFAAAMLALPLVTGLAGWGFSPGPSDSGSTKSVPSSSVKSVEVIGAVHGDIIVKFVLDGKKFGRDKDIDCISKGGRYSNSDGMPFVCDFAGAGPKIAP